MKLVVFKSTFFTKEHHHLIFYILKNREILHSILTKNNDFVLPSTFNDTLYKEDIYKYIRRVIRRLKPTISKGRSTSMQLDKDMYNYKNGFIYITTREKGKRIKLKVNTNKVFKGNLRLHIEKDRLIISKGIQTKIKINEYTENKIGLDKNYIDAVYSSSGEYYGKGLNTVQKTYTDKINEKDKKRQPYYNKIKEYKKQEQTPEIKSQIQNIYNNNLGKVKRNKMTNRYKEEIRKKINSGLNQLIEKENPTKIVHEDLKRTFKSKKKFSKRVNNLLSSWCKGLIQERMDYKAKQNSIETSPINPAFTSQECPFCHRPGERKGDMFYCHPCLGDEGVPSGFIAALNIYQRDGDKDITLKTPYKVVGNILNKRLVDKKVETSRFFGEPINKPNSTKTYPKKE